MVNLKIIAEVNISYVNSDMDLPDFTGYIINPDTLGKIINLLEIEGEEIDKYYD